MVVASDIQGATSQTPNTTATIPLTNTIVFRARADGHEFSASLSKVLSAFSWSLLSGFSSASLTGTALVLGCCDRVIALAIMRASRSSVRASLSQNAAASGENTSSMPMIWPLCALIGQATTDRIPSARQFSRSTRESISASSQMSVLPVRRHSPEKPAFASR